MLSISKSNASRFTSSFHFHLTINHNPPVPTSSQPPTGLRMPFIPASIPFPTYCLPRPYPLYGRKESTASIVQPRLNDRRTYTALHHNPYGNEKKSYFLC